MDHDHWDHRGDRALLSFLVGQARLVGQEGVGHRLVGQEGVGCLLYSLLLGQILLMHRQ